MRFYRIEISDRNDPSKTQVYTSRVGNINDPGALNVQFSATTAGYASLKSTCVIQIQGIPIKSISQANNLNDKNITIYGGFQKGLPLANPQQNGIIFQGWIIQAFGNWLGTDMTLDLIVNPGTRKPQKSTTATSPSTAKSAKIVSEDLPPPPPPTGSMEDPINGSFTWPAGIQLSVAIREFLKNAFPQYPEPRIQINPNLVIAYSIHEVYNTLSAFANWVKGFSKSIIGIYSTTNGEYNGVEIALAPGNLLIVVDGTPSTNTSGTATEDAKTSTTSASSNSQKVSNPSYEQKTIQLQFKDLIGQPTWISQGQVQFKCPMRADIGYNDIIIFPEGIFPTIAPSEVASTYNYRNSSQQKGKFYVWEINHYGNFRQPTADAWVSLFRCAPFKHT